MSSAAPSPTDDLDVVVVGAARTPQGRLNGALAQVAATELGSVAVAGALARGGVPPEAVEACSAMAGALAARAGRGEELLLALSGRERLADGFSVV